MSGKPKVSFFLSTAIGGVLFLLPVVIIGVVLVKAVNVMMLVAEPMSGFLPIDSIGGVALANMLALILVILLCFLAGLVARHALAGKAVGLLESKILVNLPGYMMIKKLASGFDQSQAESLKPVALQLGSAERFGFEIQKLSDGRSMVYIPSSPSAFSGISQILPEDQVTYLDVPVTKIIEITENFGHGANGLLDSKQD